MSLPRRPYAVVLRSPHAHARIRGIDPAATHSRTPSSRSVAMKLTSHKTEAVYRRYAIVAENDLREAGAKLAAELDTDTAASLSCSLGDI